MIQHTSRFECDLYHLKIVVIIIKRNLNLVLSNKSVKIRLFSIVQESMLSLGRNVGMYLLVIPRLRGSQVQSLSLLQEQEEN